VTEGTSIPVPVVPSWKGEQKWQHLARPRRVVRRTGDGPDGIRPLSATAFVRETIWQPGV
jgi:hypothetical protein